MKHRLINTWKASGTCCTSIAGLLPAAEAQTPSLRGAPQELEAGPPEAGYDVAFLLPA